MGGVVTLFHRLYLKWPDRLWKRLTVNGEVRTDLPESWPREPCWLWIGGTNGDVLRKGKKLRAGGYGYIRGPDGKMTRVHLLTYRELRGEMPDGYLARHTCNARRCGNPWHAIPGTNSENQQDRRNREREASA